MFTNTYNYFQLPVGTFYAIELCINFAGEGYVNKLSTLKLSLVTLLSFSTFIGCGDKFNSDEVGSEAFEMASSLSPDAEEAKRFEKMSTNIKKAPSINSITKKDSKHINVRIYKGQLENRARFKRFNLYMNNKYFYTVTHCKSSHRYCNVKVHTKYLNAGQTYRFSVVGLDPDGDWTSKASKDYKMHGSSSSSSSSPSSSSSTSSSSSSHVGRIFFYDGLHFRVKNTSGDTCRLKRSTAKKYNVYYAKPSSVNKVNYQSYCNY